MDYSLNGSVGNLLNQWQIDEIATEWELVTLERQSVEVMEPCHKVKKESQSPEIGWEQ